MTPSESHDTFAPMALRKFIRSSISGSFAAFLIIVSPSAKMAALIIFSVAPTEGNRKLISPPISE